MTHPITPPPELVQQWVAEIWREGTPVRVALSDEHIVTRAAQWGADQELEACCDWLHWQNLATHAELIPSLRDARRPKSPSLKEQALAELEILSDFASGLGCDGSAIRRALEALND